MRTLTTAASLLLATVVLVGCGSETGDDPATASPTPDAGTSSAPTGEPAPTEPLCADVWKDGSILTKPYSGCHDAEADAWVEPEVLRCSSDQRIVTFADSFYAVPGREIVGVDGPLKDDPEFTQMVAACTA